MTVVRKLAQNFVETEVDEEVLIVDLDGGELFSLSGTARVIWRLIDGVRNDAAILVELGELYGQQPEMAAEMASFLAALRAAKLIA